MARFSLRLELPHHNQRKASVIRQRTRSTHGKAVAPMRWLINMVAMRRSIGMYTAVRGIR